MRGPGPVSCRCCASTGSPHPDGPLAGRRGPTLTGQATVRTPGHSYRTVATRSVLPLIRCTMMNTQCARTLHGHSLVSSSLVLRSRKSATERRRSPGRCSGPREAARNSGPREPNAGDSAVRVGRVRLFGWLRKRVSVWDLSVRRVPRLRT